MFTLFSIGCDEKGSGRVPESLLWKVEINGRTSWVFGTIHVPNPVFSKLPEEIKSAIGSSELFMSEIEPDEKSQVEIMNSMLLPDGQTLERLIGPEKFKRLELVTDKFVPPISPRFLNTHKIWAASLVIAWPRKSSDTIPLDILLYEKAKLAGCKTKGIEKASEQTGVLDSFNTEEQIQILEDSIVEAENNYSTLNSLLEKYITQDIGGMISEFYDRKTSFTPGFKDKFVKKLLIDRNHLFLERTLPEIKEKSVFVAIGAGHLLGDEGLITLLEKSGCSVEPVKFNFDNSVNLQFMKMFYFLTL